MLVLARKANQKIVIGDNVVVCVMRAEGETVKLGIEAPATVPVFREEIYTEIQKFNRNSVRKRHKRLPIMPPAGAQPFSASFSINPPGREADGIIKDTTKG